MENGPYSRFLAGEDCAGRVWRCSAYLNFKRNRITVANNYQTMCINKTARDDPMTESATSAAWSAANDGRSSNRRQSARLSLGSRPSR